MKRDITQIPNIIVSSLQLIGRHFYLYFIPLAYFLVAGFVLSMFGVVGLSIIIGISIADLTSIHSTLQAITTFYSGLMIGTIFILILIGVFFTGYFGGLGHMMKGLLATDRVNMGDFITGIFCYGPRLFFGLIPFAIILSIPIIWGYERLFSLYQIYDFATMDSGWNSQLRQSIGNARGGIVFWSYLIQFIIFFLLSFWWVISISETRHFFSSFIRSIGFVIKNPVGTFIIILLCFLGLSAGSWIFSSIFQFAKLPSDLGNLLGLYLFTPFVLLVVLQFYNPAYMNLAKRATSEPGPIPYSQ
ncbi:MAG: hypothetical protein ABIG42_01400, partial [bacterium]